MSRLWSSGFELQSATTGVEWDTSTGTMSISTSTKRSGAAALRCNPTAGTGYLTHTFQADTINRTFHRFYLNIATLPSADTVIYGYGDSGNVYPVLVRLKTTGVIQFHDSANYIGTASAALSTGVWYRIEIDYTDNATLASTALVGYINGTNFSGTALTSQQVAGGGRIRLGVQTTCTADLYFDDVAVNSNGAGAQSGLPGPGAIVHLLPDSAGDNNGWATAVGGTAGAANNFTRVNETTPNDATSYNQTALTGTTTIDDLNCGSSASAGIGASDAITLVQVGARIGSIAATAASIVTRVKSQAAGTVLESGSTSVALNGWSTHAAASPKIYALTSYVDPQAAGPWTSALLDTMQIGYRGNVAQTTTRRVSTLWALVEYTPGGAVALTAATALTVAGQLATTGAVTLGAATSLTAAGLIFGDPHPTSPPAVSANSGDTVTCATFTPDTTSGPVVLVAVGWHDTAGGNSTNSSAITDSRGLTWTKRVTRSKGDDGGAAQNGHVQMSTAVVPQGTPTAMTVTTTGTNTGGACELAVYVHPDVDPTTPIGAVAENSSTGIASLVVATAHAGERAYVALSDWNVAANPTAGSGQTALLSTGFGTGPDMRAYVGIQNAVTATSGTNVTMSTATPTSGATNNVIAWSLNPKTAGASASATLTAATSLVAAGTADRPAAAALTAATTLAATATPDRPATAMLGAATALASAATRETSGAAGLAAATTLTADATPVRVATAALGAVTALAAAATADRPAAATLTAVTTLTAAATPVRAAAATLGAATTLTAAGVTTTAAAAALGASTALTAAAARTAAAAAALTAATTLTAAGSTGNDSSATLTATATIAATATATRPASAALTATTSVTAAATRTTTAAANLAAATAVTAGAGTSAGAAAALTATTSLTAAATSTGDTDVRPHLRPGITKPYNVPSAPSTSNGIPAFHRNWHRTGRR